MTLLIIKTDTNPWHEIVTYSTDATLVTNLEKAKKHERSRCILYSWSNNNLKNGQSTGHVPLRITAHVRKWVDQKTPSPVLFLPKHPSLALHPKCHPPVELINSQQHRIQSRSNLKEVPLDYWLILSLYLHHYHLPHWGLNLSQDQSNYERNGNTHCKEGIYN